MRALPWLSLLECLVGIGAVAAGIGLMLEPSGTNLGMDRQLLDGSPFSDFFIPGLVLLAVNGLGQIAGSVASFRGWRWAGELGLALGIFLLVWIFLQVYWLGPVSWLQPTYFVVGLIECALSVAVLRSRA